MSLTAQHRLMVWRPAVAASGVDFAVRVHDLRHAHASWLLSGGSDIRSVMDRMGHAQITTTQKYLHPLAGADHKNLTALNRIRATAPRPRLEPPGEDAYHNHPAGTTASSPTGWLSGCR